MITILQNGNVDINLYNYVKENGVEKYINIDNFIVENGYLISKYPLLMKIKKFSIYSKFYEIK